jgi:hypothetical protein
MDGIHVPACFQQRSNQLTARRFDDASHLVAATWIDDVLIQGTILSSTVSQERHQESAIWVNRSSRVKGRGFPWWIQQLSTASIGLAEALNEGGYKHITV